MRAELLELQDIQRRQEQAVLGGDWPLLASLQVERGNVQTRLEGLSAPREPSERAEAETLARELVASDRRLEHMVLTACESVAQATSQLSRGRTALAGHQWATSVRYLNQAG